MAIRRVWCLKVLLCVAVCFSFLQLWNSRSQLLERWFRFFDFAPSGGKGINFPSLFSEELTEPECRTELLLLILVASKPDHQDSRKAIRRTWASPTERTVDNWQVVFLVGRTLDVELDWRIHNEQKASYDILMGDYLDSYRNLTLKVMHGMKWAADRCRPRYILKTDDDCFVNTHYLPSFLRDRGPGSSGHLYVGSAVPEKKRVVIRDPLSERYVSYREYEPNLYPPYANGIGYIVSFHAAKSILRAARTVPPIPVEDAYLGILAERAGIGLLASPRFAQRNLKWSVCNYRFLMVIRGLSPEDQALALENLRRTRTSCNHSAEVAHWR
ncbi:beta-1,3-galactosyltransferase 5-like [Lithobates pipiens]